MVSHQGRRRKASAAIPVVDVVLDRHDHDADYAALRHSVTQTFADALAFGEGRVFTTDVDGLYDLYLSNLSGERQIHTCYACRQFIHTYGGLVAIGSEGRKYPAMWNAAIAPDFYGQALSAMSSAIQAARVTGLFLSAETMWGTPVTKVKATGATWEHLAVTAPNKFRDLGGQHMYSILSLGQAMAAKREDHNTVARALAEFTPELLAEALRVLKADAVNRAEKFVGPVQWLIGLHEARAATRDQRIRDNLLWRAVASAPDGYCHPRSSVVGSLLEDIAARLPFEVIRAKFNAKVHGLRYQRPQAAPSTGNLVQAEKLVEKMGIAPSLERRFARLEEIQTIWKPRPPKDAPASAGVFGHLAPKDEASSASVNLPPVTMTWAKFAGQVMPDADKIEIRVPNHGNFMAMLTAVNSDAPPILKWDREDARNPVSVYVYLPYSVSSAESWNLVPNIFEPVTGIALRPNMWGDQPMPYLGEGVTLIIKGCMDQRADQGNALFPDNLRGELHEVRSTIEAYSKRAVISGREDGSACGYGIGKGVVGVTLRVTTDGKTSTYMIDRWD